MPFPIPPPYSPSSVNGTIQAPVYSHVNTQQLAPRGFATKAKPLSSKGSPSKGRSSPSKGQSSPGQVHPSSATGSSQKDVGQVVPKKGQLITDIDSVEQIHDYKPQGTQHVIKETVINSDPEPEMETILKESSIDGKEVKGEDKGQKVKGENVIIIEVSTERKSPSGRKTPTSVVELFDAKTDGTLIF